MPRAITFTLAVCTLALASADAADFRYAESIIEKRRIAGKEVQSERDEQQALFNYYFRHQELKYETKLENLPRESTVPKWRIPYSAAIHPESGGGLGDVSSSDRGRGLFGRPRPIVSRGGSSVLSKYDAAFHGGENLSNAYEVDRIVQFRRALLPRNRVHFDAEHWEGYCSGFTASTIRHPEPVRSVDAGDVGGQPGVVFTPSEIKALLTCCYNRTSDDSFLFLAPPSGRDGGPNMGSFHLTLGNYIGRAGCPVAIDRTKGQESWNNPIYTYKVRSIEDAGSSGGVHYKDVVTTITYSFYGSDEQRQTNEAGERVGNVRQSKTFHYRLALDGEGHIIGGRARSDSGHFLWIPLYAIQATRDGKFQGNPYLDVRKVIALARASARPEIQEKYDEVVIGPRIDPLIAEREKQARERAAREREERERAADAVARSEGQEE